MKKMILLCAAAAVVAATFSQSASAGIVITAGQYIGSGGAGTGQSLAADRFRSFQPTGGDENYLGVPDVGLAGNRSQQQLNWMTDPSNPLTSFDFTFQYDQANDKLVSTIAGGTIYWNNWSTSLASRGKTKGAADLNAFQITVANRDANSNVFLTDVVLDNLQLGTFQGANPSFLNWLVTGSDMNLTDGFTLTGKLWLQGPFSVSQENSRVELTAGWDSRGVPPAVVPEPASLVVWPVLGGIVAVGAWCRKRRKAA